MSESTVNISDFHGRGITSRPTHVASPNANRPYDLIVMQGSRSWSERTGSDDNGTVFDIGLAREAEPHRSRCMPRLVPIQRRAKVLHFSRTEAQFDDSSPCDAPVRKSCIELVNDPWDEPPAA